MTGRMPACRQVSTAAFTSRPRRVDHADEADEDEVLLELDGVVRRRRVDDAEREAEHAHAVLGQRVVGLHDPRAPLRG